MSDPNRRTRARYATVALAALISLGVSACGVGGVSSSDGQERPSGNSDAENEALAADLGEQIAEAMPEVSVQRVSYSDDITVPATLVISVDVHDPAAAAAAAAAAPVPDIPPLVDPGRPLAPVAAQIAQIAWLSEMDPMRSVAIYLDNGIDPSAGDSFGLGVGDQDIAAAFEEAFGPRPG